MAPFLLILTYLPAFGMRDFLALFALLLTAFVVVLARVPRPVSEAPSLDAATEDSVAALDRIIQHLRAERWPEVARDCAYARETLAAVEAADVAAGGAGRSRLPTAMEHLARLESLALAQSGTGPVPDAAAWVRVTLDLQEIRAILRERASR